MLLLAATPAAEGPAPAPAPAAGAAAPGTAPAAAEAAREPAPAQALSEPEPQPERTDENGGAGYTPSDAAAGTGLVLTGYVDVGFAAAQGDGTSFAADDTRIPLDYGSDPFAPAVNSRGDVASTDSGGRFLNGFLPRSAGIGGEPSFLLNTASVDLRYTSPVAPLLVFTRLQAVPRLYASGEQTQLVLEQAFGRVSPLPFAELALFAGKFDSVFGIEYLENEANLRTGITPSLIARYTTGQSLGVKAFYRLQLPVLLSALSLNVAGTNSGTMVESLQGPSASLSGRPVGSARLGYELDLPGVQVKAGGSALYGPRNDQRRTDVLQQAIGGDLRVTVAGLSLSGELVRLTEDPGPTAGKLAGTGSYPIATEFHVTGWYATVAYALAFESDTLQKLTPYLRYERRRAEFEGFPELTVDRLTAGLRLDLLSALALKGEWLRNDELAGAPVVANDVITSSAVFTW